MPARSKKQQMAAGAALAAKRGEKPESTLQGASAQMYGSMSEPELAEVAQTQRKGLPTRKRSAQRTGRSGQTTRRSRQTTRRSGQATRRSRKATGRSGSPTRRSGRATGRSRNKKSR
jgi:hypothetical protein